MQDSRTRRWLLGIGVFFGVALSATLGSAQGRPGALELSPFFGAYFFDGDLELDNNFLLGARLGYWLTDRWEAEFSGEGVRTHEEDNDDRASLFQTHLDALYHFNPAPGVQPYLVAGVGAARYNADEHDGSDWDPMINYGLGLKAWVTESVGFRIEARQPLTFGSTEHNWMVNAGLSFLFGGAKPVVAAATPALAAPKPVAPADADKDGVADASDACPGTPAGVKVDAKGCPLDSDGDGVYDYLDKCPGTPKGTPVDKDGCPLPALKATISVQPDAIEQGQSAKLSWSTQGASEVSIGGLGKVEASGSKTVSPKESTTYKLTATGPAGKQEAAASLRVTPPPAPAAPPAPVVKPAPAAPAPTPAPPAPAAKPEKIELTANFDTNSDVVKPQYFPEVERVAKYMKDHPKAKVVIEGHTDSVGSEESNMKLSARRANAIAKLLSSKYGVAMDRVTAQSLGETKPVADNKISEGRAKNRRIYAYIENE